MYQGTFKRNSSIRDNLFTRDQLLPNIGLDKQNFQHKSVNIFLPISLNICFGCSKEPSNETVLLSTHNIYLG